MSFFPSAFRSRTAILHYKSPRTHDQIITSLPRIKNLSKQRYAVKRMADRFHTIPVFLKSIYFIHRHHTRGCRKVLDPIYFQTFVRNFVTVAGKSLIFYCTSVNLQNCSTVPFVSGHSRNHAPTTAEKHMNDKCHTYSTAKNWYANFYRVDFETKNAARSKRNIVNSSNCVYHVHDLIFVDT